jgi:hypothetical protein
MGRHHKTEHPDNGVPADSNGRFDIITNQSGWHPDPKTLFRGLDATTELPAIAEPLVAQRNPTQPDDGPKTYTRETLIFTSIITAILTAGTAFITFYAIAAHAGLCQ